MPWLPDVQAGNALSARWLSGLLGIIRRAQLRPSNIQPPLFGEETATGIKLTYVGPQIKIFQITGGSQPYAASEVRDVSGSWQTLPGGLVSTTTHDPLYERNGSTSVPSGSYVEAKRAKTTARWVFDNDLCVTSTAGSTTSATPPGSPIIADQDAAFAQASANSQGSSAAAGGAIVAGTASGVPIGGLIAAIPTPP